MYFSNHLLIKRQSCHHIETCQLICRENRLAAFYMMATLAFNELNRLQNAVQSKDRFHKYRYKICMDVYNGELKRHLSQSQYGHIGESILTDKLLKYNESGATTIRHNGKCNK